LARKSKPVKPEVIGLSEGELLRPFWYDLPAAFYLRVNKAAAELGTSRKELVSRAVDRFIKDSRKEKRQLVLPATPVQEELIKDFQRRAGALRWKNVSPEERREITRRMAQARWGSKKTTPVSRKVRKKSESAENES
jgi:hypothetical protein